MQVYKSLLQKDQPAKLFFFPTVIKCHIWHHASITPEVNKHERRMGNAGPQDIFLDYVL
jgi:hypothetical protein